MVCPDIDPQIALATVIIDRLANRLYQVSWSQDVDRNPDILTCFAASMSLRALLQQVTLKHNIYTFLDLPI
jgi:hypothetical protein